MTTLQDDTSCLMHHSALMRIKHLIAISKVGIDSPRIINCDISGIFSTEIVFKFQQNRAGTAEAIKNEVFTSYIL